MPLIQYDSTRLNAGESTFDETLLPFAVLPNNQTVAEALGPELAAMYQDGRMPKMLEHSHRKERS